MDELLRTLDDYAEIVNRMRGYGYIGNIGEGSARQFSSDYLVALIKAGNIEPTITKRDCDDYCDDYPYRMVVRVGTHTLYCLLSQGEYDVLIEDGILVGKLLKKAK